MSITKLERYEDYQQAVTDCGKSLMVIDFYADWCGPCKRLSPELQKLAEKFPQVKFFKVNVEEQEKLTQEYNISGMPTIVFLRSGSLLETVVGAKLDLIKATLEKFSV